MKKLTGVILSVVFCFLLTSFSPSLDGRAVVADSGVMPQGVFAKTVGYLPGDSISVTNLGSKQSIDILVIGALDPSEGVAILLSPEAAKLLGMEKGGNNVVKITKRSGQLDEQVSGTAVIGGVYYDSAEEDSGLEESLDEASTDTYTEEAESSEVSLSSENSGASGVKEEAKGGTNENVLKDGGSSEVYADADKTSGTAYEDTDKTTPVYTDTDKSEAPVYTDTDKTKSFTDAKINEDVSEKIHSDFTDLDGSEASPGEKPSEEPFVETSEDYEPVEEYYSTEDESSPSDEQVKNAGKVSSVPFDGKSEEKSYSEEAAESEDYGVVHVENTETPTIEEDDVDSDEPVVIDDERDSSLVEPSLIEETIVENEAGISSSEYFLDEAETITGENTEEPIVEETLVSEDSVADVSGGSVKAEERTNTVQTEPVGAHEELDDIPSPEPYYEADIENEKNRRLDYANEEQKILSDISAEPLDEKIVGDELSDSASLVPFDEGDGLRSNTTDVALLQEEEHEPEETEQEDLKISSENSEEEYASLESEKIYGEGLEDIDDSEKTDVSDKESGGADHTAHAEALPSESVVGDELSEIEEDVLTEGRVLNEPEVEVVEETCISEAEEEVFEPESEPENETYEAIVLVPSVPNPPETAAQKTASSKVPFIVEEDKKPVAAEPSSARHDWRERILSSESLLAKGTWYVQVAVLSEPSNIQALVSKYEKSYPIVLVPTSNGRGYKVLVGPLSMDEYGAVLARFRSYGYKDAFLKAVK